MGVLAGSSRPLKKDHPAAADVSLAVRILREESKKFPWLILSLVGRDGRSVRGTDQPWPLSDAEITARVNQMGGVIGLAGLIMLRGRLATFVRPFSAKPKTIERLTRVMENISKGGLQIVEEKITQEENDSPIKCKLFTDGKEATFVWPWENRQLGPEWEFAGVFYVAVTEPGRLVPSYRATDSKWLPLMKDLMPRFDAIAKETIEAWIKIEREKGKDKR